eukprot:scaffold120479_cov33-Tisochrysis_lutea.AAC.1
MRRRREPRRWGTPVRASLSRRSAPPLASRRVGWARVSDTERGVGGGRRTAGLSQILAAVLPLGISRKPAAACSQPVQVRSERLGLHARTRQPGKGGHWASRAERTHGCSLL